MCVTSRLSCSQFSAQVGSSSVIANPSLCTIHVLIHVPAHLRHYDKELLCGALAGYRAVVGWYCFLRDEETLALG